MPDWEADLYILSSVDKRCFGQIEYHSTFAWIYCTWYSIGTRIVPMMQVSNKATEFITADIHAAITIIYLSGNTMGSEILFGVWYYH